MIDKTKLISQKIATKKSWIRLESNRQRPWGLLGVDTGIHDLNLAIGGWVPTDVNTIAARSGIGKTASLIPSFSASLRHKDVKPEYIVFTWEMEASNLVDRIISYETGLTIKDLMVGAKLLDDNKIKLIKDSLEKFDEMPIVYQQHSTNADEVVRLFSEFKEQCVEQEKKDGVKRQPIAFIDYIGLADFDQAGVRTYGINDFYSKIKQCANRTGGTFNVLAQIQRASDNKDKPDRTDLSDSQAIENNSDNLIIMHRPEYLGRAFMDDPISGEPVDSKHKMLFRVLKCRKFGPSEFITGCDVARNRFWSLNLDPSYPYWELYDDENFWKDYFGYNKKKIQ